MPNITLDQQRVSIESQLSKRTDELLKYRVEKETNKKVGNIIDHSVLLSAEYQGADSPTQVTSAAGFTELGELTTDIMSTVFHQVMSIAKDDNVFLKYLKGFFSDSQLVWVTIDQAIAGLASGGTFAGGVVSKPVSGRNKASYQTGFWASKSTLGETELVLIRENGGLGSTYAREAMKKCIMKVVIELFQRQVSLIPSTIANNEYT